MDYTIFRLLAFTTTLICSLSLYGQALEQDRQAIKAMQGCYQVDFKYTETFAPEPDYEKAYDYTSSALEWAELVVDEDDKLVLQHILVVMDTVIIKHWRQDWLYENQDFYSYADDQTWVYEHKPYKKVKGQWTQNVYQVDDSPRYSGSATWVHVDGKSYWENTADAPLPRREYSKRSDYNIMQRGNRQEITSYGWLHEQDNNKVIRSEAGDELLAQEKGMNIYTRVLDKKCQAAREWWAAHQAEWADVREVWSELYSQKQTIKLKDKIEDKRLYEHLFYHDEPLSYDYAQSVITKYLNR